MIPRILSIAGTDPSGGAGLQADLKSIDAFGGYGMGVVTALVAQNTHGVRAVHVPELAFLQQQLEAVSDDVVIDAVKLGMLHSAPVITVVDAWLKSVRPPLVVLDPVMVATSGDRLLDAAAVTALRALCGRTHLVTPNLPELAILVDQPEAQTWREALAQAQALALTHDTTVLVKGGHLPGDTAPDAIVIPTTVFEVPGERIASTNTHGTGCSLSSAMATLGALGFTWNDALVRAKSWLLGAIKAGSELGVGSGNGPVDHLHEIRPHIDLGRSFTADVWGANAAVQRDIETCSFVASLADGTLPRDAFHWYLAQDAVYLRDYARVLAAAAMLAPTSEEQDFWARGSAGALAEEANLHRTHVGSAAPEPSATTTAYLNHLLATVGRGSYAEIVAAVLPCYWVYTEVGTVFGGDVAVDHPYRDWLVTYSDPEFAAATRSACAIVDRAARQASPAERAAMVRAFEGAMRHELAFFCAPLERELAVQY